MNRSVSGGDVTESLGINNDDNVSSARSVDFLLPQEIHNIPTGAPKPTSKQEDTRWEIARVA